MQLVKQWLRSKAALKWGVFMYVVAPLLIVIAVVTQPEPVSLAGAVISLIAICVSLVIGMLTLTLYILTNVEEQPNDT